MKEMTNAVGVPREQSPNRLVAQHYNALRATNYYAAQRHNREYLALADEWGQINEFKRGRPFTLEVLARGGIHGGGWGHAYQFPGCDDPLYFRRRRHAAAVMIRPYNDADVVALREYADERALQLHSPPNPRATFWFPPFGTCVVITAAGADPIRWHPDQLRFSSVSLPGHSTGDAG